MGTTETRFILQQYRLQKAMTLWVITGLLPFLKVDGVVNKKVYMNDTFVNKEGKKRIPGTQQEDLEPGHFVRSLPIGQ